MSRRSFAIFDPLTGVIDRVVTCQQPDAAAQARSGESMLALAAPVETDRWLVRDGELIPTTPPAPATPPRVDPVVGRVTLAQTASVTLLAGIRELTLELPDAEPGKPYTIHADHHSLNGGSDVPGCPAGYVLLQATCRTAGQIAVAFSAPLLTLNARFSIACTVMRASA